MYSEAPLASELLLSMAFAGCRDMGRLEQASQSQSADEGRGTGANVGPEALLVCEDTGGSCVSITGPLSLGTNTGAASLRRLAWILGQVSTSSRPQPRTAALHPTHVLPVLCHPDKAPSAAEPTYLLLSGVMWLRHLINEEPI